MNKLMGECCWMPCLQESNLKTPLSLRVREVKSQGLTDAEWKCYWVSCDNHLQKFVSVHWIFTGKLNYMLSISSHLIVSYFLKLSVASVIQQRYIINSIGPCAFLVVISCLMAMCTFVINTRLAKYSVSMLQMYAPINCCLWYFISRAVQVSFVTQIFFHLLIKVWMKRRCTRHWPSAWGVMATSVSQDGR